MKFVNDLATGSKIIRSAFPEFANSKLVGDDSGWDNYAIIVDDKYIFRFPRRADALKQIKQETEVLEALQEKLPAHLQAPKYLKTNLSSDFPFVYYKMIQGQPLSKDLYNKLSAAKRTQFAQNLVEFLHILHGIEVSKCQTLKRVDVAQKYKNLYQQISKICFKYLTPAEQIKTKQLFDSYLSNPLLQEYSPAVVHGDLSENHILLTESGLGIIDFGDTCIFDPAIDLAWFYLFDKNLFQSLVLQYLGKEDTNFINRIAKFYVPIIPYYGILFGEETKNTALLQNELADLRQNLAAL